MKPASVINQGDDFVTLRATTDRPAEIQEALATRDVQHVFKGDQNQAWDAVLARLPFTPRTPNGALSTTLVRVDRRPYH